MWRDLRFGLRMLAKHPTFTLVAVLTLGLGIGATTAMFSVVNAVVVKPLPYAHSDELVRFYTEFPKAKLFKFWLSPPEYFELGEQARSYASLGAYNIGAAAVAGRERPVHAPAAFVTASLLPTLGVQPALGRFFTKDEDLPGDARAVVLGHDLWKTAFRGDPQIVGKQVVVEAQTVTVVGVMPKGFDFPGEGVALWLPLNLDRAKAERGNHFLSVIGRLQPGVSLAQARSELTALMRNWQIVHAGHHPVMLEKHPMLIYGLKEEVVGGVRWTLWLLQGAVLFVLLIACANISNLLLARAEARTREIAIRNALGADRGRLVRQFLTESVLLGLAGLGLGIIVAVWGVDATLSLLPDGAPRANEIRVDWSVLVFALGCTLATSLLFGLAPIVHTRVDDLGAALKEGQRTVSSPRGRFRRALVVTEVALAVVLVIGCGLMMRSFSRLSRVDTGFRPDGLVTMEVDLPEKSYATDEAVSAFWARLQERLATVPGVESATLMSGLPPWRRLDANDLAFPGRTPSPDGPVWNADFWQVAGQRYFETMGIKLVAGRFLGPQDTAAAPGAIVVNESFARKFFPGEEAVGKQILASPWKKEVPAQTIVGVVADVKQQGLDAPTGTELYIAEAQVKALAGATSREMHVVVRAASGMSPRALLPAMRGVVSELDPSLPVAKPRSMDEVMWSAVAKPRFLTFLLVAFGLVALVLAAVGIYGVMSYSVAQRTRELGIRMALGAQARGVRRLVLRDGMFLAGGGILVGLAAAVLLNVGLRKVLAALLFQIRAFDPPTFAAVTVVVLVVAAIACLIPALRATRVDPMIALRRD